MDSPLSDNDSLSSVGASTEPLPASDQPRPFSSPNNSPKPHTTTRQANDSDSSLTEQSDSDAEESRSKVGALLSLTGSVDEEDGQQTPTKRTNGRRAAQQLPQSEADEEEDGDAEPDTVRAVRGRNVVGRSGAAAGRSSKRKLPSRAPSSASLSDPDDDLVKQDSEAEVDSVAVTAPTLGDPPGSSEEEEDARPSAALGRAAQRATRTNSKTPRPSRQAPPRRGAKLTNGQEEDEEPLTTDLSELEPTSPALDARSPQPPTRRPARTSRRATKPPPKSKAAPSRATSSRSKRGSTIPVQAPPSIKRERSSSISSVNSRASSTASTSKAQLESAQPSPEPETNNVLSALDALADLSNTTSALLNGDQDEVALAAVLLDVDASGPKANLAPTTSVLDAELSHMVAPALEVAESLEGAEGAEVDEAEEEEEEEEDEGESPADAEQVALEAEVTQAEAETEMEVDVDLETDARAEGEDGVEAEDDEEEEEERPKTKGGKRIPTKGKKGAKGGKKGKGGQSGRATDADQTEAEGAVATPAVSEDDTSDDASLRKRAEAMEALTKIEIDFARLRDRLYIERMAEVEEERKGVINRTHPELLHLVELIEMRRHKKLELAKRWLDGLETSYQIRRDSEEHTAWVDWSDGRDKLRTEMQDDANRKRRKLDREKRAMDRPKDDSLTPLLMPRSLAPAPLHHTRRVVGLTDAEPLTENEIIWSLRNKDVRVDASVSALNDDAAWTDLEQMGLRERAPRPVNALYYDPYAPAAHLPHSAYPPHLQHHLQHQQQQQPPAPFLFGGYDPTQPGQQHLLTPAPRGALSALAEAHSNENNWRASPRAFFNH